MISGDLVLFRWIIIFMPVNTNIETCFNMQRSTRQWHQTSYILTWLLRSTRQQKLGSYATVWSICYRLLALQLNGFFWTFIVKSKCMQVPKIGWLAILHFTSNYFNGVYFSLMLSLNEVKPCITICWLIKLHNNISVQ